MNIWRKRITDWLTHSINYEGDCRTAPATPGLLISDDTRQTWEGLYLTTLTTGKELYLPVQGFHVEAGLRQPTRLQRPPGILWGLQPSVWQNGRQVWKQTNEHTSSVLRSQHFLHVSQFGLPVAIWHLQKFSNWQRLGHESWQCLPCRRLRSCSVRHITVGYCCIVTAQSAGLSLWPMTKR